MKKQIYNIWFSHLKLENNTKLKLLKKYDTEEIWNMSADDFQKEEIHEEEIMEIITHKKLDDKEQLLKYMLNKNIKLFSIRDKKYPRKLLNIENKPAFLYIRGNENILDNEGVRNCRL